MIWSYWCDQKGRRLHWETGVLKRWALRCFLKDMTEGIFLIWKEQGHSEELEKCLFDL